MAKNDQLSPKGKNSPAPRVAQRSGEEMVFSYLALRKTIGFLGLLLPFVVFLGALKFSQTTMQDSVSGYYYTGMRDVFVGTLWAIGFFLFSYRGYDYIDDLVTDAAGIFAVGISLFPTTPAGPVSSVAQSTGSVHFAFAALFFVTLSCISLFLFTKKDSDPLKKQSERKPKRDFIYRVTGIIMLICIGLIAIYSAIPNIQALLPSATSHPIFWLEAIADVAFGVLMGSQGTGTFEGWEGISEEALNQSCLTAC